MEAFVRQNENNVMKTMLDGESILQNDATCVVFVFF